MEKKRNLYTKYKYRRKMKVQNTWLSVLNGLKNRGVKDILIICADGLSGIKEAI